MLCCNSKFSFQFGNKACCYCYSVIVSQKIIMELDQNAVGILICTAQAHQLYKLGMLVSSEHTATPEKLPSFRLGHNIFCEQNVVASDLPLASINLHKNNNRDFKIVHDGRLGRLDECHVTQNPRDI